MKLKLNGIDVDCIIGERPDERGRLQKLRVDVELTVSDTAAETDELSDTVDYAALTEKIRAALVAAKCKMIECAAKVVYDVCIADDKVSSARVSVTKSGAVPHLESASVTVDAASSPRQNITVDAASSPRQNITVDAASCRVRKEFVHL